MPLLKNNQKFRFRSYGGKEPTVEQLREELESLYKFIEDKFTALDKAVETAIDEAT